MFKATPRPAVVKKHPAEKEFVGQQEHSSNGVGHKAPFLSRLVGKM